MTSKMISIRDDVYRRLKKLKEPNESFSELIDRLITNQKKYPLKFYGIAADLSDDLLNEFEDAIIEGKKDNISSSDDKFFNSWGK